jgi:putative transposase
MAEIRVYHENAFLCRAVCQELADQTISLQEIIRARNRRLRALRGTIRERSALIQTYIEVHEESSSSLESEKETSLPMASVKRLKRYHNE